MEIGENIKKFRNIKGLTQKQLAKELKVTPITIQNYENNRRKPDFVVLNDIAGILDCKLYDLLGVENEGTNIKENSQSYYLEQYIHALGYEINPKLESGYLTLKSKNGEYDITQDDINNLENNSKSFIEYNLYEIIKRSRNVGK